MTQMSQLSQCIQEFCPAACLEDTVPLGSCQSHWSHWPWESQETQRFPSATSISSHSFWPGLVSHPRVTLDINKINQKHIRKCIGQSA